MLAFLQSAVLPTTKAKPRHVCGRKLLVSASANRFEENYSWEQTPNYQAMGSGVPASGLQRIEFIIRQDGTVEEKVTGVRGKHCDKITEKIEEALGKIVHTERTDEYFQEAIDHVVEKNSQTDSVNWPGAEGLSTW